MPLNADHAPDAALSPAAIEEIWNELRNWQETVRLDVHRLVKFLSLLEREDLRPSEARRQVFEASGNRSTNAAVFEWNGYGNTQRTAEEIERSALPNLELILNDYVAKAVELIASKWRNEWPRPEVFNAKMNEAGEELLKRVNGMAVSALRWVASPSDLDSLMNAVSSELNALIGVRVRQYASDARVAGLPKVQPDAVSIPEPLTKPNRSATPKRERSIGSEAAVQAVHDYMKAKDWDETTLGRQFQTTGKTVAKFLREKKLRRSLFAALAEHIGVSPEELLAGQLPPSIKRPQRS